MNCGPEFELIERLFAEPLRRSGGGRALAHPQALGIGDDAAVLAPLPADQQLVFASDLLVEGRHYFPEVDPRSLGHKMLAVNCSDLAAMGAQPLACTLSMAIRRSRVGPSASRQDRDWLVQLAQGLQDLATQSGCALVGGDTVGLDDDQPESFSIAIVGTVPLGQALRRDGLQPGDQIWISGQLGDGAWAVRQRLANQRLNWPQPRLALGQALRGLAHAAIDVSDGLSSELGHLAMASAERLGQPLVIQVELLSLVRCLGPGLSGELASGALSTEQACCLAAASGDEYELCFAAPAAAHDQLIQLGHALGLPLTPIGRVEQAATREASAQPQPVAPAAPGGSVVWLDEQCRPLPADRTPMPGFDHFGVSA
jgi:thiamine-monophosphate kinase